jgi:dephospho-CoA kinase
MKKVGLTGGIGSGKTTVAKIFETLGIPVYYADQEAKRLMVEDASLVEAIKELFGEEAYDANGRLNRAFIAQRAFPEPELLKKLEALVHPAVLRDGERWHAAQRDAPYTIKEAALLFESGSYRQLDKVITVFAPLELRIQRVMARDKSAREDVEARIARQMPEEEKLQLADFVVYNDGSLSLISQVWEIHNDIAISSQ